LMIGGEFGEHLMQGCFRAQRTWDCDRWARSTRSRNCLVRPIKDPAMVDLKCLAIRLEPLLKARPRT
jgi:hypothetical protein